MKNLKLLSNRLEEKNSLARCLSDYALCFSLEGIIFLHSEIQLTLSCCASKSKKVD